MTKPERLKWTWQSYSVLIFNDFRCIIFFSIMEDTRAKQFARLMWSIFNVKINLSLHFDKIGNECFQCICFLCCIQAHIYLMKFMKRIREWIQKRFFFWIKNEIRCGNSASKRNPWIFFSFRVRILCCCRLSFTFEHNMYRIYIKAWCAFGLWDYRVVVLSTFAHLEWFLQQVIKRKETI